ncbi:hypothetical protein [Streptomyces sp. PU-14G]|uniref:hypothetical protein n=1 Tax=Streptomyces sp. PU-14G TaxID=2800808 RepID=UPI0034E03DFA
MTALPRFPRWLRYTLLAVLAVALVAAGAFAGALTQRKEPKKFTEVSGNTCQTVLLGLPSSVLDRLVPESHYVGGWQKVSRKKGEYGATCAITADGKRALTVSVKQMDSSRSLDRPDASRGKAKKLSGFPEGWSVRGGVAAALPCTRAEGDDQDENTKLHVKVESSSQENDIETRKDLVRVLKVAAEEGNAVGCFAAPLKDTLHD